MKFAFIYSLKLNACSDQISICHHLQVRYKTYSPLNVLNVTKLLIILKFTNKYQSRQAVKLLRIALHLSNKLHTIHNSISPNETVRFSVCMTQQIVSRIPDIFLYLPRNSGMIICCGCMISTNNSQPLSSLTKCMYW